MGILPNAQPNILWCLCCAQLRFEPAMATRAGETCGVRQKPETSAPSSPCIQAGRISWFRGKNRSSCSTELLRQSINLGDTHLKEPLLALVISCSYPFAVSEADSMEVKLTYYFLCKNGAQGVGSALPHSWQTGCELAWRQISNPCRSCDSFTSRKFGRGTYDLLRLFLKTVD